jgi:hypothetical protein
MLIKILCNKLLLDRATSQLASCTEPNRAGSLFSRATKTGSARARSERRAGPSRAAASPSQLIELELFSSPNQHLISGPSIFLGTSHRKVTPTKYQLT